MEVTAETVVGATTGVVPPPKGYLQAMKSVCEKYGALFILDEVMSGMGRKSRTFLVNKALIIVKAWVRCTHGRPTGTSSLISKLWPKDLVEGRCTQLTSVKCLLIS